MQKKNLENYIGISFNLETTLQRAYKFLLLNASLVLIHNIRSFQFNLIAYLCRWVQQSIIIVITKWIKYTAWEPWGWTVWVDSYWRRGIVTVSQQMLGWNDNNQCEQIYRTRTNLILLSTATLTSFNSKTARNWYLEK